MENFEKFSLAINMQVESYVSYDSRAGRVNTIASSKDTPKRTLTHTLPCVQFCVFG
jgi:hypothetical protein